MLSRDFLELVARAVNVDASSYANDSKLEQKVIYALKNVAGDAVKATGVLTSSGVLANNETVTIGGYVYTFKTTLTGAAFEVLLGANAAAALDNLKSAINATAGAGTTYGTGTYAHPDVTATTNTDTAQTVEAKNAGTEANAIATTETGTNLAWGAATLASGANGTYYKGQTGRSASRVSGGKDV